MIKKKIIAALVVGSLISGTVAWYGTSVYARGEGKQEQKPELGKGYGYTQMLQIKADILEITAEELNAGKNIHHIIEEKGLTSEEFDQKMLAAVRKRLESMVETGLLTQEQLEIRLQLIEQHHAYCEENEYGIWYEDSVWGRGMLPWAREGSFPGMRWVR